MASPLLVSVSILTAVVLAVVPASSFAQEGKWIQKTSGAGSLDVMVEPIWTAGTGGGAAAQFKVSFLTPNSTQLHQHQDYDVIIRQGDKQVFSAAGATGQSLLHNVNGEVTVPVSPMDLSNGEYTVEVQVLGLGFPPIPITPEVAKFPITVTPEFPVGLAGLVAAAVVASSVVAARKLRL